jgi:splicing factor 1
MRRALDAQRDVLLERLMDLNPTMCNGGSGPKFLRKVYIPYKEYPTVNFMGMVIGPRGNTQKHLEKDTNCKISVRGRGAKGSETSASGPATGAESLAQKKRREDDEDELHVQITSERLSELEACVSLITDILKPPADDDQSAVRKLQLLQVSGPGCERALPSHALAPPPAPCPVQLALVNGTLREMNAPCHSCGEMGHRQYECPYRDAGVKRAHVTCALCGDGGGQHG